MRIVPIMMSLLNGISSVRVFIPKDVRSNQNRQIVSKSVQVTMDNGNGMNGSIGSTETVSRRVANARPY